ncbi:unnamed protein product, partial [Allacma fusca]
MLLASSLTWGIPLNPESESQAKDYLEQLEPEYSLKCNEQMEKRWAYITNVTAENEQASVEAANAFLAYQGTVQSTIKEKFPDWNSFTDPTIKREFKFLAMKGPGDMKPEEVQEMNKLVTQMETAYSAAQVCEYGSSPPDCKLLSLDPDIIEKLRSVKDFNELAYYWNAWHDKVSELVSTKDYSRFIQLQNTFAKANNYSDMGEFWAASYDNGKADFSAHTFQKEMLGLWGQLKPYYNKLHAYVRMKLRKTSSYADKIKKYGYLPANIMGNMWAQEWTSLEGSTKPYPNAPSLDATGAMIKEGYTVDKMFQVADEFFSGMGLLPMTDTFKEKSLKVKPTDRSVVCHASAEDMCKGKGSTDFRIKMCTSVNQDDLVIVHHEMGHIEYFMQYTDQPIIFRDGANPGFHEAIGDCMALSVTTPKHLQCTLKLDLGYSSLCDQTASTKADVTEADINFLYYMALQKFPLFPFAISMDSWRWGVFDGSIPEAEYNKKWWEIRQDNQGIVPPLERNLASSGLDAAAKYHISANVEYIRYFISYVLQFQFYESLCIKAGEFNPDDPNSKPLYQCDFAGNTAAGDAFGNMLKLGFSKPWPEALQILTGKENIDISSILKYFKPLFDLIDRELQDNGEVVGFGREFEESVAKDYVSGFYEKEASRYCNLVSVAEFNYETNLLSDEAEQAAQDASREYAEFEMREFTANISQFDYKQFIDEDLKRQLS